MALDRFSHSPSFKMVCTFCRVKTNIVLHSPMNESTAFTPTVPPSDDLKTAARRDVVRFTCVRLMMNCLWLNSWIKLYLTTAATLIRLYNNIETLFPVGRKSAGRMSQIRTRTSKTLHNGSGLQYHALTSLPLQCLCCVSPPVMNLFVFGCCCIELTHMILLLLIDGEYDVMEESIVRGSVKRWDEAADRTRCFCWELRISENYGTTSF